MKTRSFGDFNLTFVEGLNRAAGPDNKLPQQLSKCLKEASISEYMMTKKTIQKYPKKE